MSELEGTDKIYRSIEEWAQAHTPKGWRAERYRRLSKRPEELAEMQVEELMEEIRKDLDKNNQSFVFISPESDVIEQYLGEGISRPPLEDAVHKFRAVRRREAQKIKQNYFEVCNGWKIFIEDLNGDLIKVATLTEHDR